MILVKLRAHKKTSGINHYVFVISLKYEDFEVHYGEPTNLLLPTSHPSIDVCMLY